ncbi:hypothetical protein OG21DRAFT_1520001 [Imleria badia]|nr:hypothetical protein OG21DRAFT_1520001 [Imleria badia]
MASAFFYGTLMHPKISKRVIRNGGPYLQIRPALLLDYTRHKINEYTREVVLVHALGPLVALDDMQATGVVPPMPPPDKLQTPIEVNTYVWCRPLSELQPRLWTFEEFVEENAWKWIGAGSRRDQVDRRRAMEGIITVRAET